MSSQAIGSATKRGAGFGFGGVSELRYPCQPPAEWRAGRASHVARSVRIVPLEDAVPLLERRRDHGAHNTTLYLSGETAII